MGRRRAYDTDTVVQAARDLFWERGYELTSIGDLEERTGLDRSSLYHAFGSKEGLFEAALQAYLDGPIAARLASLHKPGARLDAIVNFFYDTAWSLRAHPDRARRGCLIVNTLGEQVVLESHAAMAEAYRDRFKEAFGAALRQAAAHGEVDSGSVTARASLLTATVMGLIVSARIDPLEAARVCESVVAEVASWQLGPTPRHHAPRAKR
jgi:AcrR family transcriptional regulator